MPYYAIREGEYLKYPNDTGIRRGRSVLCFKNIPKLLEYEIYQDELTNNSQIYMLKLFKKIDGVEGLIYAVDFQVTKKLSTKELIDEYTKTKADFHYYKRLFDIIFEAKDLKKEDITRLYKSMIDKNSDYMGYFLGNPKVDNELLEKAFDDGCLKYNFEKGEFLNILYGIAKNPNISLELLEKVKDKGNMHKWLNKYIVENPKCTPEIIGEVLEKGFDLDIWLAIINSPSVTTDLIKEMLWEIRVLLSERGHVYKLITSIIKSPIYNKEICKEIVWLLSFFESLSYNETPICIGIIDQKETDEEIIDLISKGISNNSILFKLIKDKKLTSNQIDLIINKTYSEMILISLTEFQNLNKNQILKIINKTEDNETLIKLVKSNKLTLEQLESIINKTNDKNVLTCILNNSFVNEIIEILKNKVALKADIKTFKKLYLIENLKLKNQIQNQSEYSEVPPLDYTKERLKLLNGYLLKFNILDIRIFILEEMYKLGYLSKNKLFDEKCIPNCQRSLKLCPLFQNLNKKKNNKS